MPLVSIVVPVYKINETLLRECLNSLVDQTLKDIEIILIDDGSPDKSGQILDEYAVTDTRIQVIHQENSGVSAARNAGLDRVSGEWVSFVDADDWVELDMCERILGEAENNPNLDMILFTGWRETPQGRLAFPSSTEIVGGEKQLDYVDDEGRICLEQVAMEGRKNLEFPVPLFSIVGVCSSAYRVDMLKRNAIRFIQGVSISEDALFSLYAIECANTIRYKHLYVYHYRMRSDSAVYGVNGYIDSFIETSEKLTHELLVFIVKYNREKNLLGSFYLRVVQEADLIVRMQIYHPANSLSSVERTKKANELFDSEPYRTALRCAISRDIKQRVKLVMLRLKWYRLLSYIPKIKLKK